MKEAKSFTDRQKKGRVHVSAQENEAIILQKVEGPWEEAHAWVELFDPQCRFPHLTAYGLSPTLEGFKQFASASFSSFSNLYVSVEEIVAEDDKAMVWTRQSAIHSGPWRNIPATNKQISYTVIYFFRFEHGKVIECRAQFDTFSFLQQVGAIPKPE
jgi:predicted ester cyclase